MKGILKKLAGLFLTGCLMASVTGCQSGTPESSSAPEDSSVSSRNETDNTPIRLYVVQSGTQKVFAYVMQKLDLAEKYGLNIEYIEGTGVWGAEWTAFQAGEIDVTCADYISMASHKSSLDTVNVCGVMGWLNGMAVKEDSGINSFSDLKGKNIGVFGNYSTDYFLMTAAYKQVTGEDFPDAAIADAAVLSQYLEKGELDAIYSYGDTNLLLLAKGGYKVIATANDCFGILKDSGESVNSDAMFTGYAFTRSFYEEHPELVEKFVHCVYEAYDILMSDSEEYSGIWKDLAVECYGMDYEEVGDEGVEFIKNNARKYLVCENPENEYELIMQQVNWFISYFGEDNYKEALGFDAADLTEDMFLYFPKG